MRRTGIIAIRDQRCLVKKIPRRETDVNDGDADAADIVTQTLTLR
jgi:hypothetical protein